jgi:predicted ATP-binding protein involved in virulence
VRITEISVTSLFGMFDHKIPLHLDDRTTIIHGPNGFGKTIVLRMLDGLFNDRYRILRRVPFRTFRVAFDNGEIVSVNKTTHPSEVPLQEHLGDGDVVWSDRDWNDQQSEIAVTFSTPDADGFAPFYIQSTRKGDFPPIPPAILQREIAGLERMGSGQWIYLPTEELMTHEEVLERFGDLLPRFAKRPQPDWWSNLRESIDIQLIETQRLLSLRDAEREPIAYRRRGRRWIPAVEEYAAELARTIQDKLAESAALSQSLDRSFPRRLVEQTEGSTLTEEQLQAKLHDLENKRNQLKAVGLLDGEEDIAFMPTAETIRDTRGVLAVYVQDVERKLSVFDDLARKLALFKEIINQRFLHKQIVITKSEGFAFVGPDERSVPLESLSSGEQHEVVLLYHLLFRVRPDALVLIDEPELSLHVAWQKQFLRDLQKVTSLASFDVLLATHSPQIIHDRWDLTVELNAPAVT